MAHTCKPHLLLTAAAASVPISSLVGIKRLTSAAPSMDTGMSNSNSSATLACHDISSTCSTSSICAGGCAQVTTCTRSKAARHVWQHPNVASVLG